MKKQSDEQREAEFLEKLGSLEVSPPDDLWLDIQNTLKGKKKKSDLIITFYAFAAAISLLIAIGSIFFLINSDRSKSAVTADSISSGDIDLTRNLSFKSNSQKGFVKLAETIPSGNKNSIGGDTLQNITAYDIRTIDTFIIEEIESIHTSKIYNNRNISGLLRYDIIQNYLAKSYPPLSFKEKAKPSWFIAISGSPVYSYHTISSAGGETMLNESGIISWGGAITIRRTLNRWLSLESGLSINPFGQKVNDLFVQDNGNGMSGEMYQPGIATSMGEIKVPLSFNVTTTPFHLLRYDEGGGSGGEFVKVSTRQVLRYLEIPIIFSGNINLKKFTIRLNAGIRTGFLVGNNLIMKGEGVNVRGKTIGTKPVILTGLVSAGFVIPISNRANLLLEPGFNYCFGSLSASSIGYKPYSSYLRFGIELPLFKN